MGEMEALYKKVYFAKSMDQILKETILLMLRQMIIGGGGTVPDLSNYPTKSDMQIYVGDAISSKVDVVDFNAQIGTINTSLTNKLESTDLQPIRSDLSTLSGTVNTKVSNDHFTTTVGDLSGRINTKVDSQILTAEVNILEGKINNKVDTATFNSEVSTINTELTKKLETVDFTDVNNRIDLVDGKVNTKIDSSALTPINDKLTTLSGTVNTKVSTETFNTQIGTINTELGKKLETVDFSEVNQRITTVDNKVNTKVSEAVFNTQIDEINTELTKKLETVDFSDVNQRISTIDSKVNTKVETATFNNQITATNNKIATDISTARRSTLEEVNRDYLPRAEYADLGIQLFDRDNGFDTRDFKIFTKTVTTYAAGLWDCDFSEADFKYPPHIFVTAHARNKGEAAGDACYATIIPSTLTETYVRGRLSSASSAGLLAAMVNVAAEGSLTVVAIGQ